MEIDIEEVVVCANTKWTWIKMYRNERMAIESFMATSNQKVGKM